MDLNDCLLAFVLGYLLVKYAYFITVLQVLKFELLVQSFSLLFDFKEILLCLFCKCGLKEILVQFGNVLRENLFVGCRVAVFYNLIDRLAK